jgi:hypothetical protein
LTYPSDYYYTQEELNQMPLEQQLCYEVEQQALSKVLMDKAKVYGTFLNQHSPLTPLGFQKPKRYESILKN